MLIPHDEFDHKCSTADCPSKGQCTRFSSCLCHVSREKMMLDEIEHLRSLDLKPLSTYPEDRAKMLALCAKVEAPGEHDVHAAVTLADLVRSILEDEAVMA